MGKEMKDMPNEENVNQEIENEEILDEVVNEEVSSEETVENEIPESESSENKGEEETSEEKKEEDSDKKASEEKKEKKKIFGKKDKKDQQIEELTDKHQRLMAEFQNYRNRSEKEKSAMFEVGAKSIVEKLLPIVDNFERGIAALSEEEQNSPTGQGMKLIYKQLMTAFEEMGVTVIEAKGQQFDPELHNAVMHEDNEELEENVVVEEFQKGYKYRDSVIRHSMVKVAN